MSALIETLAGALKHPKKKVALVLAYLGTRYQGMQINPNAITVESVLFKGLVAAGLVSESNAVDQKKIGLMRACRTDKGVHAAMQIVSLKLIMKDPIPDMIASINSFLPDDIRVFGIHPVSQSFNSKLHCDSRVYEYLVPTFMFQSGSSLDDLFLKNLSLERSTGNEVFAERIDKQADDMDDEGETNEARFESNFVLTEEIAADLSSFRLSTAALEKIRASLKCFEGSHLFHNYTIKKSSSDSSSRRQIMSFTASDPFVLKNSVKDDSCAIALDSSEWILLTIHGQSFMLHQIRKLVGMHLLSFLGMIIMILRLNVDNHSDVISRTLTKTEKMNVPKAPSVGLLLAKACFSYYNARFPDRTPLSYESYADAIETFKKDQIYPAITKEEFSKNIFMSWWSAISMHAYDFKFLFEEWAAPEPKATVKKFKKKEAEPQPSPPADNQ